MPNIIIDTSVILEGKENVEQLSKDSNVFVTDIILQELDGNKGAEGAKGYNAREFFRILGKDKGEQCDRIPLASKELQQGDTLRKMSFGLTPLYVFVRKNYKTRNINDSKIIEMAKDYDMKLVTNDVAQRVRALSEGVDGEMFEVCRGEGEVAKIMLFAIFFAPIGFIFAKFPHFLVFAILFFFFYLFFPKPQGRSKNSRYSNRSSTRAENKNDGIKNNLFRDDTYTSPGFSRIPGNIFHHD